MPSIIISPSTMNSRDIPFIKLHSQKKKQDMSFIKSHCALIRSIQTSNSLLEMHICCRTLLVLPSRERVPLQR